MTTEQSGLVRGAANTLAGTQSEEIVRQRIENRALLDELDALRKENADLKAAVAAIQTDNEDWQARACGELERAERLKAENERLRNALINTEEYWIGRDNDRAALNPPGEKP